MGKPIDWLLSGPPWSRYLTRKELLGQDERQPVVSVARQDMLASPEMREIVSELSQWPGPALTRHNDAAHLLHKLVFLAELGVVSKDEGIAIVVERIMNSQSNEGAFQILTNIPQHFGGSGRDELGWMLCDAPLVLYAMAKLGLEDNPSVQSAARHLAGMGGDGGWKCAASPKLGKFRGPGRKGDPCPYATLVSLKALSQFPDWRDSPSCKAGVEVLLQLWQQRHERRPYLFAMGTDFAKLKAPCVWYDILHLCDVLTRFPELKADPRLDQMLDIVSAKADPSSRFTAESVWKAWSGWEFGQKKAPSYLVTLTAVRTLARVGRLRIDK